MAWQDIWQPDEIDGTEAAPMIDYDEEDQISLKDKGIYIMEDKTKLSRV